MNSPTRTCIGCGRKAPQVELVRFVEHNGRVLPDPSRARPGRGAYTCRSAACFERAAARRSFARTVRRPVRSSGLNPFPAKD